ncbi:MAG: beta-lactamase protein, partial [Lacrimispora sp.]|nr:beta-lactamase protein [Lacrimispora sp.]
KKAVIVDPGDEGAYILEQCGKLSVTPEVILLTHGHFDHIMAVEEIKRAFPEVIVYAGEKEKMLLNDPSVNLSTSTGRRCSIEADRYVTDGEMIDLAGISTHVIATPGHTEGCVCYYMKEEDVLISGDTLFLESLGRTDLPTGDQLKIISSIRGKLFPLPGDTMVYPGHGSVTTIGHEKSYNPVALYRG